MQPDIRKPRRGRSVRVGVGLATVAIVGVAAPASADHSDPATADQFKDSCQGPASKYICAGGYLTHFDADGNRSTSIGAIGCTAAYAPGTPTMSASFNGQFYQDDYGAWVRYGQSNTSMGSGNISPCSGAANGWARRYAPVSNKRIAQRWASKINMSGTQFCTSSGCGYTSASGSFEVLRGGHGI